MFKGHMSILQINLEEIYPNQFGGKLYPKNNASLKHIKNTSFFLIT